nr:MAG TPA: hypothetical protein [Bacteriophage sp.]
MRTNRPTHHLIVQSQRKRRPGQHHRVELRIVEARRQHADIRLSCAKGKDRLGCYACCQSIGQDKHHLLPSGNGMVRTSASYR